MGKLNVDGTEIQVLQIDEEPDTYQCNQNQSHSAGTYTTADFYHLRLGS